MPFIIEDFSSFICFVLPNRITLPPGLEIKSFEPGVNPEYLQIILDQLHKMYEPAFKSVAELMMGSDLSNFHFFMKSIIARCLKISEKVKSYGHFLLACTLIKVIVEASLQKANCFFHVSLCSYCLVAVYNICYKEYFDCREGTDDSLNSCIVSLKQFFSTRRNLEEMRNVPLFGENDVTAIMDNLINVKVEGFPLGEYELKMLNLLTNLPVRPSPAAHPISDSESSCRETDAEDTTTSVSMEEDCSDSSRKENEPELACSGVNREAAEPVAMEADYADLTSRSSESESSCRDITPEEPERGVPGSTDCSHYKHRICDVCGVRCAIFAVLYIEDMDRSLKIGNIDV